ncbi:adenine deaminase [Aeoliella sp. SH292]|uniref:adenine deaminase n=1 Tax=Aeoliella sp. SH292 TaxID=3454464 RepID=UPI003F98FFE2
MPRLVANVVDIAQRTITPAEVVWEQGQIVRITPTPDETPTTYLLPGFVDAHVHVESSMLVPTEFARAAVVHGTVATVSDPHEIGNVLGVAGVEYMLENAAQTPFKFCFGAPSCVPATTFETAGATITVAEVEQLLANPRIGYLSEMMNFPGILHGDPECLAKVAAAKKIGKPVDGHAPGLRGEQAAEYFGAGITTDHECFTKDEAIDKLAVGCKISIREGSAARNFDALYTLIGEHPGMTMLCSDDKHPDELLVAHINALVRRAVAGGVDLFEVLRAACVTPVEHYSLPVGQLREGDAADFIEVDSLEEFNVLRTWIDGECVAERGMTTLPRIEPKVVNQFQPRHVGLSELDVVSIRDEQMIRVIEAVDGQLVTNCLELSARIVNSEGAKTVSVLPAQITEDPLPAVDLKSIVSDTGRDILKLVVVNRYRAAPAAVAFIKNFGLERGALASSVAHDSHNVIAVGVDDADLVAAINLVMDSGGGLSAACVSEGAAEVLPLPVAGLMATGTCEEVGTAYGKLDRLVKAWGSPLRAPYMTLSFMALLVIPALKLSDLGLFDGGKFEFTDLVE